MALQLEVMDTPLKSDVSELQRRLTLFNQETVGPSEKRDLCVVLRGSNGGMRAALSGYTAWNWLYVQWLFIDEDLRGQGVAQQLLAAAEGRARERGCVGAHIDTFSDHGLHAYEKAGYEVFGVLEDFPIGRQRTFLKKRL